MPDFQRTGILSAVDDAAGHCGGDVVICPGATNDVLLEAFTATDASDSMSLSTRFRAMVARELQVLGGADSVDLVYPLGALLARFHEKFRKILVHASLAEFLSVILATRDSAKRARLGLYLGDRGMLFAGGLVGSRNFTRAGGDRVDYGLGMAQRGYGIALAHSPDGTLRHSLNPLIRNPKQAVRVLEGIVGPRSRSVREGDVSN